MTDTTPGATIYYNTNGTYPGSTSTRYTAPFTISTSQVIVAVAVAPGYQNSTWTIARYLISSSSNGWIYSLAGNGSPGYSGDGAAATLARLANPQSVAVDSAGNLFIADYGNNVVRRVDAQTGIISTVAGNGTAGHTGDNGPAISAEVDAPHSIAVDPSGNVYIGEWGETDVRKIAAGTGIITTYAGGGSGPDNAPAATAYLGPPEALATDAQGNLYIATYQSVRKVTANTAIISTVAGGGGAYGENGPATSALMFAVGVAVDQQGNLYICDNLNNAVRKVNINGIITTIAGGPSATSTFGDGGPATNARLNWPYGVAADQSGNVYIGDTFNNAIRKVSAGVITTVAGNWSSFSAGGDGDPATSAAVPYIENLTADNAGNLYYADFSANRIRKITVAGPPPASATTPPVFSLTAGTYTTPEALTISDTTPGASIYLSFNDVAPDTLEGGYYGPLNLTGSATLTAVAVAPGSLPSAPVQAAYTITAAPSSRVSTVAGVGYYGSSPSGLAATAASVGAPQATALDQAGNLYFSELGDNVVRMVSAATGVETIVAGTGSAGFTADGVAATTSELNNPMGIAVDKAGNLYIADYYNYRVRMVAAGTGLISTVAGPGVSTILGDGGPATSAYVGEPSAVALDPAGNLYIADFFHNRIRMVDAVTGIITTVVGTGASTPFGGDGGLATAATLAEPIAVAVDGAGNLYIDDQGNARIRKVTAKTGIIETIAGTGMANSSTDGSLAIDTPIYLQRGIAVDTAGNVFFPNWPSSIARVDATTGILTTVAGNHYGQYSGDGGDALIASVNAPQGVTVDLNGDLYIADTGNDVVRKVTFHPGPPVPAAAPAFSIPGGSYIGPQSVTLSTTTPYATVYYTTDGSAPSTASTVYSGAITIDHSEILQAIAVAPGFTASAAATASYTITPATPLITWPAPAPITFGTALSATQLNATSSVAGSMAYSPAAGTVLGAGSQTLNVTFAPTDATAYTSASATANLTVTKATATNGVSSSAATVFVSNPVTLTATLTSSAGSPTGTVIFYDGTAPLGTGTLSAGVAAYTTSTLTAGSHSIAVSYSGDANFNPVTSAPFTETIEDFAFAVPSGGSTSATASLGGSANYTLAVTPSGATSASAIAFTVSGLPTGAVGTFNPASLAAGSGPTNVTLTISIPASAAMRAAVARNSPSTPGRIPMALGVLLLPLLALRRARRALGGKTLLMVMVLAVAGSLVAISGCGGGGGGSTTTPPAQAQTYTLTVTATAGSLAHATSLTLTVQ